MSQRAAYDIRPRGARSGARPQLSLGVRQHTGYYDIRAAEIFVALVGEGTDVWRPVRATALGAGVFEIAPDAVPPSDEVWAFGPGERVRCERRTFAGGEQALVAVERAARAV